MENDSLLKAILLVSILMLLAAIGWTWLEVMNYWKAPPGKTASAQQRGSRVAWVCTPETLRRS